MDQPQNLPSFQAALASTALNLMIARTEEEKRIGLMFRDNLSANEGMLFCYKKPQKMVFWMKNTRIPLDLLFFTPELLVSEMIEGMQPGIGVSDAELPLYAGKLPAQFALELPAGSISRLKIRLGDRLNIPLVFLFDDSQ